MEEKCVHARGWCLLKHNYHLCLNCPCTICILKSNCTEACKERKDFFERHRSDVYKLFLKEIPISITTTKV